MVDFGNQHRQVIARPVEGGDRAPQLVGNEVADPVADRIAWHRPGDAVALGNVAAQLQQDQAVFRRLDALGDNVSVEGAGEADDAFDDGQIVRVVEHVADEGLVDLERIGGQTAEVGQRRVTGPEIVQSQRDTQAADSGENLGGAGHVVEGGGFENLDFQTMRRHGWVQV